ncbi:hypothetical protein [Paenibacillus agri]|uniref:Uncharacterized protein n=2 Tax=Paenibacillus TaxID=44249 RepID=A0A850EIW1_9BACL|nr:hypothetical protein [Paenibacillus agri]NUU59344.1 hypothetical protein [Paenibacillus agri]
MNLSYNSSPDSDPGTGGDNDTLIQTLLEQTYALQKKLQQEDDEETAWMLEHTDIPVLKDLIKELTIIMLHVLDAIGQLEPVNGITISKQFGFPKGSVFKNTRKCVFHFI